MSDYNFMKSGFGTPEDEDEHIYSSLQELLDLNEIPKKLECFDISHTFGEETVGPKPVEVDKLATKVFDNISKDFGMKFYPRVWIPLMMAFRFMPWEFFRRIKF